MSKVDLHVHSKYSNHPSEWFLQRLGASESYTEPEFIYQSAKKNGMDFVTVTDHNSIDAVLELKEKFPRDVFTGVESTAYFPEDGCKVHILIYGFDEGQFENIQRFRRNIYDLRDYLWETGLAHAVAHASFSVNGKISRLHLEKLLLLFNVFEARNGGRSCFHNETWTTLLSELTPEIINYFYRKYRIAPRGENPWIKGLTGGSDDHAGLFIGQTYTSAKARTPEEFLVTIRERTTAVHGRHNNYKSLAFMFYKIAYEFSRQKGDAPPSALLRQLTEFVFESKGMGLKDRLLLRRARSSPGKNGGRFHILLADLIEEMGKHRRSSLDVRFNLAYDKIAAIADEFFNILLESLQKDLRNGDLVNLIKSISASIPGVFLSVPFFSTVKLMSENRRLLVEMQSLYGAKRDRRPKKVLWFTDSADEGDGFFMAPQSIVGLARERGLPFYVVSSCGDGERLDNPRCHRIDLPPIHMFRLPGQKGLGLRIPSVLMSLEKISELEPDEIIISTPGPVGWLGFLAARLLNAKCVGVYHADSNWPPFKDIPDESLARLLRNLSRTFFSFMDEILVPTEEDLRTLVAGGLKPNKIRVLRRAVDSHIFSPRSKAKERLQKKYGLAGGLNLLYVGQEADDHGLDFILRVHRDLCDRGEEVNLLIMGRSPDSKGVHNLMKKQNRVHWLGPVDMSQLPDVYSAADLLVLPNPTKRLEMKVLEAQACGLPALVLNRSGLQDIIIDHQTGFLVETLSPEAWVERVIFVLRMMQGYPWRYLKIRQEARSLVLKNFSWDNVIKEIFHEKDASSVCLRPQQCPEPDGRGVSQSSGGGSF